MVKRFTGLACTLAALLYAVSFMSFRVHADTLQSPSYRFEESTFTGGGLLDSSSNNYQARDALGDIGIGDSSSSGFQVKSGSHTPSDPTLSVAITDASAGFGSFSSTVPSVATSTFEVSNYTSYGYVVHIVGDTPTNGSHSLPAMSETGASQTGEEQFGINLVANTSPTSFGSNPDQGQFGEGEASANYNTPNQYRYVAGEQIAEAPKSSGITVYTISYIINVANLTPGGQYRSNQQLIVTGTY